MWAAFPFGVRGIQRPRSGCPPNNLQVHAARREAGRLAESGPQRPLRRKEHALCLLRAKNSISAGHPLGRKADAGRAVGLGQAPSRLEQFEGRAHCRRAGRESRPGLGVLSIYALAEVVCKTDQPAVRGCFVVCIGRAGEPKRGLFALTLLPRLFIGSAGS